MIGPETSYFKRKPQRRSRANSTKGKRWSGKNSDGYSLRLFVAYYALGILLMVVCMYWAPLRYAPIAYLVAGFALNRAILTRVHWHHYTVTLADVAAKKLWALLLWPLIYPVFIGQIFVARYL